MPFGRTRRLAVSTIPIRAKVRQVVPIIRINEGGTTGRGKGVGFER